MAPLIGAAVVAASIGLLCYFLPWEGRPRVWDDWPFVQSLVPLTVVSGIAIGGAMLFGLLAH
jgi:hypothetical protein